jgi:hypothetical protein
VFPSLPPGLISVPILIDSPVIVVMKCLLRPSAYF